MMGLWLQKWHTWTERILAAERSREHPYLLFISAGIRKVYVSDPTDKVRWLSSAEGHCGRLSDSVSAAI